MTIIIISLLLLVSLLPNPTFTAHVGIVNGREAKPHSRPYMVSIQIGRQHVCGGFLISDQFVLTAAHCGKYECCKPTVVVGAHDLSKSNISDRFRVMNFTTHPDYNKYIKTNDIMLMKLEQRVCLNNNVDLISLPEDGEEIKEDCSVAGWGRLMTKGTGSDRLMEANTEILSDGECESKLLSDYKASIMICVHGSGGTCKGDSGGPLVCGKKPTAFGITSFGDPDLCNSPERPNVYTKISAYLPWIRKEIGE